MYDTISPYGKEKQSDGADTDPVTRGPNGLRRLSPAPSLHVHRRKLKSCSPDSPVNRDHKKEYSEATAGLQELFCIYDIFYDDGSRGQVELGFLNGIQ